MAAPWGDHLLDSVPYIPEIFIVSFSPELYSRCSSVIYFINLIVCIHQSQCLNSSQPLLPSWCPYICSQHLCLYFCFASRFICTIFLDSTHICWYTIFTLFLTYFTVWHSLNPSTSLQIAQFCSFLWLSSIPLYISNIFFIHSSVDRHIGCRASFPGHFFSGSYLVWELLNILRKSCIS